MTKEKQLAVVIAVEDPAVFGTAVVVAAAAAVAVVTLKEIEAVGEVVVVVVAAAVAVVVVVELAWLGLAKQAQMILSPEVRP